MYSQINTFPLKISVAYIRKMADVSTDGADKQAGNLVHMKR